MHVPRALRLWPPTFAPIDIRPLAIHAIYFPNLAPATLNLLFSCGTHFPSRFAGRSRISSFILLFSRIAFHCTRAVKARRKNRQKLIWALVIWIINTLKCPGSQRFSFNLAHELIIIVKGNMHIIFRWNGVATIQGSRRRKGKQLPGVDKLHRGAHGSVSIYIDANSLH